MISLLLPTPGDPVVLGSWMKNLDTYHHLFDEILILVNHVHVGVSMNESPMEDSTFTKLEKYYNSFSSDKIKILRNDYLNEHGYALNELIETSKNDYLMLIEDDHYIFDIKGLEENINLITSGKKKVIGKARGSCTEEIQEKFAEDYPERYALSERHGCSFWPSYYLFKKELYYLTDKHLHSKNFEKGNDAGYVCATTQSCDTAVWFNIQLHDILKDEDYLYFKGNHYHSSDQDFLVDNDFIRPFGGLPDIKDVTDLHFGSLSTIFGLRLFEKPELFEKLNHIQDFIPQKSCNNDKDFFLSSLETFRRINWLKMLNNKLDSPFKSNYTKNLNFVLNQMNVDNPFINFNEINKTRFKDMLKRIFND